MRVIKYIMLASVFHRLTVTNTAAILIVTTAAITDNCSRYPMISVYIDAGVGNTNPVTLNFVTSGPSFPRNWKVKICQIPCNTIYRGKHHF
jgi:hypothetical protein